MSAYEGNTAGIVEQEGQSTAPPSYAISAPPSSHGGMLPPQQLPLYAQPSYAQPTYAQPVQQQMTQQPVMYGTPQNQVMYAQQPQMVYAQPGQQVFTNQSGQTVIVQSAQAPYVDYRSGPCGCSVGCCSGYLTYTLLFMLFLSWVGAIVCFNSGMNEIAPDGTGSSLRFFSTKVVSVNPNTPDVSTNYADIPDGTVPFKASCLNGGKALIALATITFILLSSASALICYRIARVNGSYWCGSNRGLLSLSELATLTNWEAITVTFSFIFLLATTITWGSSCVKAANDYAANVFANTTYTTPYTGYGYLIFCMILMIASLIHSLVIRQNLFYQTLGRVIQGMPGYVAGGVPQMIGGGSIIVPQQQQMVLLQQPQMLQQPQIMQQPQAVVYATR